MAQHPEVLWAQRSSETDDEKVSIFLYLLSRADPLLECSLHHHKSARHSGIIARVRAYVDLDSLQGDCWQVCRFTVCLKRS